MPERKPQINFQVDRNMKLLYEEAKACGHWVTRFCAAGFLLMVEEPHTRLRALNRLRAWEAEYATASPEKIRAFVQGVQVAMRAAPQDSRPGRAVRPRRKKAKRAES
jgi:hypothetical protein